MTAQFDFHTHTLYLKCANETMTIPAMVQTAHGLGVTKLGITDHLNTLDKLDLHVNIREDLEELEPPVDVYFGVELNFQGCDGEFAYSDEVRDRLGFQFAIGGIHGTYLNEYNLSKLIDIQHRHHIKTCRNPLVDVLVHPYWFGKGEFDRNNWPWFDSVSVVPESYARELGQVARETGTAIEINGCANLVNAANPAGYVDAYADYLAAVAEEGCLFSVGSDAHDIGRMQSVCEAWRMAERLGLDESRIWSPSCDPFVRACPVDGD
jgi:histidinol phosphatase-like PHP family hydrolase